ncbi:MAG: DUF5062 family protein [Gammaproteobacteria bacterium]|nr:DUF5062 family protein [Gammaproteobacteria bacterium]
MKKLKHEKELVKLALDTVMAIAEKRGVVKFEATDSSKEKIEYVYRLLVHDKLLQPLAKDQENQPNIKHKLACWIQKQLPTDHPLKN